MMSSKTLPAFLAVALWFAAAPAWAQSVASAAAVMEQDRAPDAGLYDELSAGNQRVARSLFAAQGHAGDFPGSIAEDAYWSLDHIAAAKRKTDWDGVFAQMKAEGLIRERTLGQVIRKLGRPTAHAAGDAGTLPRGADGPKVRHAVITYANGTSAILPITDWRQRKR